MNKIKAKEILEARYRGLSLNEIAKTLHASKHSVSMVCSRAAAKGLTQQRVDEMSDMDVYALLFPEKEASNTIYTEVDYDYVTSELRRTGVTMKLLHEEYVDKCRTDDTLPVGYTKFCTDYKTWRASRDYSDRIIHKPGMTIEVDWSGPKMHYIDRQTQTKVDVSAPDRRYRWSAYIHRVLCGILSLDTSMERRIVYLRS